MHRTISSLFLGISAFAIVAVALVFILERQSFDHAQAAVTQYLAWRNSGAVSVSQVQHLTHATQPSAFTRAMSGATFGDSSVFQTTQDYRNTVIFHFPDSPTATPGQASSYRGTHPIPFPPADVWCAAVQANDAPTEIIFAAQHQDLYFSDWLVHAPPGDQTAAALNKQLTALGCQMRME